MEGLDRAGLVYGLHEPERGVAAGTTIALAGVGTDSGRLTALARATAPAQRIVVPDPLRFLYLGRERVGKRWYVESIDGEIEPATFGDALHAVEQLALGAGAQFGRLPLLVGHGQGGCLALALAQLAPELVAGVAALGAALPDVPGWVPSPTVLDGLPVLLLGGDPGDGDGAAAVRRAGAALTAAGARVTSAGAGAAVHAEVAALGPALDDVLADWWRAAG